ncbi:MAG: 3-deoxy-manno-octulosonate cytidylyltransferase [bacterium]|jgi:3-deoxy-manno-octulosonate cytidylyltransferase (CMP-KDO synthetase)
MRIICIIPARLGSYRFMEKPFADICGKPMIEHVYKRASLCKMLDEVYVATPNREIAEVVEKFGGKSIMTTDDVRRASDRVAQAALKVKPADIVVNLQGDEPLVHPEMIEMAIQPLIEDPTLSNVNLARAADFEEAKNIHEVKLVFDVQHNALLFSREPIPSKFMGDKTFPYYIQGGIFPFTWDSLQDYTRLESTPLEIIESIDMLRFIENGRKIRVVETTYETYSVDIPSDVEKVVRVMEKDQLKSLY